jgi:cytokinesis protein
MHQLVDTKSVNNTTLLHFLERTVAKHFPEMEEFLEELAAPAEAHRGAFSRHEAANILMLSLWVSVNLQDVRKGLSELRDGLAEIRIELKEHFSDMEQNEKYGRQMWEFVGKASHQLEDLVDEVNSADTTFTEVIKYYGEEDKNMSSAEFYGIFKTFVTSYKVCIKCTIC